MPASDAASLVRPAVVPFAVVPFAVRAMADLQPDLVPLERDPPPHVDDPGPRTVLRHDRAVADAVAAKLRAVSRDPRPWIAVAPGLDPVRAATAGREVAAVVAELRPDVADPAGRIRFPDGTSVAPDGTLDRRDPPAPDPRHRSAGAAHDLAAARRLAAVPAHLRLLEAAALRVGEDLVLVDVDGRVLWAHVCAPSAWDPGGAGGRPLAALHGPVPDADRLVAASAALGRAVARTGPHVRWTWGLTGDDRAARHAAALPPVPAHLDLDHPGPAALATLTFRAERQTTRPLPSVDAGLFAIRVHRAPLGDVLASADRRAAFRTAIAGTAPAVARYKGVARWRDALLAWLEP